ncbi:MAG: dihydrofolate reductase family protein, partial [Ilumatobacteraceae bacterium]
DPLRVVLGRAPAVARVHPCLEWTGDIPALLDELGRRDIVQVMIEGGSAVVRSFYNDDLIDRYVIYVAPALLTGRDMVPLLAGPTAPSIDAMWRGRFGDVRRLGDDLRLDLIPHTRSATMAIDYSSSDDDTEV